MHLIDLYVRFYITSHRGLLIKPQSLLLIHWTILWFNINTPIIYCINQLKVAWPSGLRRWIKLAANARGILALGVRVPSLNFWDPFVQCLNWNYCGRACTTVCVYGNMRTQLIQSIIRPICRSLWAFCSEYDDHSTERMRIRLTAMRTNDWAALK